MAADAEVTKIMNRANVTEADLEVATQALTFEATQVYEQLGVVLRRYLRERDN